MIKYLMLAAMVMLSACGRNSNDDVMREIDRADKADAARAAAAQAEAAQAAEVNAPFLAQIRAQRGVQALPSGLLLDFKHRGGNQRLGRPSANAAVLVHYEGKLSNGQVFDSSFARGQPAPFQVGQVVAGFAEAIEHMRPGDEVIATMPPELGYGPSGQPPTIPANAVLQFRIILLAFQEPGGPVVRAPTH
jgi:FKBP-type peptidyl-prolyl cis-trans isomerase